MPHYHIKWKWFTITAPTTAKRYSLLDMKHKFKWIQCTVLYICSFYFHPLTEITHPKKEIKLLLLLNYNEAAFNYTQTKNLIPEKNFKFWSGIVLRVTLGTYSLIATRKRARLVQIKQVILFRARNANSIGKYIEDVVLLFVLSWLLCNLKNKMYPHFIHFINISTL